MSRKLRIGYLTARDPLDRRSWSGTLYSMARALERQGLEVVPLGPFVPSSLKLSKVIGRAVSLVSGRKYLHAHTASLSRKIGMMAEQRMRGQDLDAVFAVAASTLVANLRTQTPIVYLSDATVKIMVDYYEDFSGALKSHVRMADQLERQSIEKSSHLIYPSSWAADSAVRDYGADRRKVSVIPFGANIDPAPSRADILRNAKNDICRLLFVGVYWMRKGGDIALETLLELERVGFKAELTIVGCGPKNPIRHPRVHFIPFIDKNDPSGRKQLDALYKNSDFFILPSRAECFSIALCEANAYGLPILTTRTGGLPELVREGVNGFLFPLEARGDEYASKIREAYADTAAYLALRSSSRDEFEKRLNWDNWGKRVSEVIRLTLAGSKAGAASS